MVIPQFIMVARDFKLANTWFALIVPPLFNSLGVLFMRQAFSMMPADLFDAARVEGVRGWRIFLRVAMPLARPTHRGAVDHPVPALLEQLPLAAADQLEPAR